MVTITLSNKNNLIEKIHFELQRSNLILDNEANFFLTKILENAQNKIEKPNIRKTYPLRIKAVRKRTLVPGKIQSSKDLNSSIKVLVNSLKNNSNGKIITSKTLFVTFNSICPLWPFC